MTELEIKFYILSIYKKESININSCLNEIIDSSERIYSKLKEQYKENM